jgi:hypothetical protein
MKSRFLESFFAFLLCGSSALAADYQAASPPIAEPFPWLSEVRLGALVHGLGSPERDGGVDLNGEVLFAKPFHVEGWNEALIPRPHIGATANFQGKTSTIYAGVTWHFDLFESPFFAEVSSGGSLNNGELDDRHDDMNPLGCHLLFRESASLGYQFDQHWSVMGTFEHNSNANLCSENRGLSNLGVRVGYKF